MQFLPPTIKKARLEDGILAGALAGAFSAVVTEYSFINLIRPEWLAGTAWEHGRAWLYGLANLTGVHNEVWRQYSWWMNQVTNAGHPYYIPTAQIATATIGLGVAAWAGWQAGKPRSSLIKVDANSVLEGGAVFSKSAKKGIDMLYINTKSLNRFWKRSFKVSEDDSRAHWLLAGGTGAGKSTVVFNLLHSIYKRQDRALIIDYKGIFERWPGKLGGDTLLIDPSDRRSSVWGIALELRTKQDARDFSSSMIPETHDPSWSNGGRSILTCLIVKLQKEKGTKWGWRDLSNLCNQKRFTIYNYMLEYLPEAAALIADSKPGDSYMAVFVASASIISDLADAWENRPGLSIKKWMQTPTTKYRTIFLKISKFKELSKLINTSVLNMAADITPDLQDVAAGEAPLWIIADEFPRIGKVLGFDTWISAGRSKDIRVVICIQSKSQMTEIYGENTTSSWIDSIGKKILGRQDGNGAKWASELVGDGRYERPTTTQNSAKSSGSSHGWQSYTQPIFSALSFQNDLGKVRNDKYMRLLVHGFPKCELVMDFPIAAISDLPQVRKPVLYADFCKSPNSPKSESMDIEKVIAEAQAQEPEPTTDPNNPPPFEKTEISELLEETNISFLQNFDILENEAQSELTNEAGELTDHLAGHAVEHLADAILGTGTGHVLSILNNLDELTQAASTPAGEGQFVTTTQSTENKKKLVIRRKKSLESDNSL